MSSSNENIRKPTVNQTCRARIFLKVTAILAEADKLFTGRGEKQRQFSPEFSGRPQKYPSISQ